MPVKDSTDIAVESTADIVDAPALTDAELRQMVADLGAEVKTLKLAEQVRRTRAPAGIAQAPTTSSIMRSLEKVGDSTGGQDRRDPTGLRPAFRANDVVALVDGDKLNVLKSKGFVKDDEPFLGVIKARMYRRRKDNQMKYNVDFPGIGEDGAMESELEMVQAFE